MVKKKGKKDSGSRGGEGSFQAKVVELVNLSPRVEPDGTTVYCVVNPPVLIDEEGWEPVGEVDGQVILSHEDSMKIGLQTFFVKGRVRSVVKGGDGSLTVDVGTGRRRCLERSVDGLWVDLGEEPMWNPVTITAERHSIVTLTVPAMSIEGLPATGAVTDTKILERTATQISDAYAVAAATARQRAVFIRPVVVRAVVKAKSGEILYRGPEILVGVSEAPSFSNRIGLTLGNVGTEALEIPLTAYRLRISVNPMTAQGWVERAATLEIEVSPQFHPWDNGRGGIRILSAEVGHGDSQNGAKRLTVTIPGVAMGLSGDRPERSVAMVEALVGSFPEVARVAAVFHCPYERGINAVVSANVFRGLVEETECLARAVSSSSVRESDSVKTLLNAPNRFSARLQSADGTGRVLYGDVEVFRFTGYSATEMAVSTDSTAGFRAITTVVFRDGSSVSRLDSASVGLPLKMNPLAVYPSSDAVAMRIAVEDDEGNRRLWAWTLHPSPSGRLSLAVDGSIAPVEGVVDESDSTIPAKAPVCPPLRLTSVIAVASVSSPSEVTATAIAGDAIRALGASRTSGGAWDFGRSRFVVATRSGTLLATVDNKMNMVALTRLSERTVESQLGIAHGPDGTLIMVDKGRVVIIDGTRFTELEPQAMRSTSLDAAVFDSSAQRVVVGSTDGSTSFYHLDPSGQTETFLTPSLGPFNSLGNVSGDVIVATQSGLYRFAGETSPSSASTTEISMTARIEGSEGDCLRVVRWPVLADEISGTLTVSRHFLTGDKVSPLAGMNFDGRIHSTLRFTLVGRSMTSAYARLSAEVTLGAGKRCVLAPPK